MSTNLKTEGVAPNETSNTLSRRRLLHVGCAGAMFSLMPIGLIGGSAIDTLQFDFGPHYSVLNVCRNSAGTKVDLGFRVNGRFFQMALTSTDEVVWRPV